MTAARAALTALIGRWQGRESLPSGAEVAGSLVVAAAGGGFTLHHCQGGACDRLTVIDPAGARYRQFDSAGAFGEEIGAVAAEGTAIVMARGETRATFAADGDIATEVGRIAAVRARLIAEAFVPTGHPEILARGRQRVRLLGRALAIGGAATIKIEPVS